MLIDEAMERVSNVDKLESIKSMQSTIGKLENGLDLRLRMSNREIMRI